MCTATNGQIARTDNDKDKPWGEILQKDKDKDSINERLLCRIKITSTHGKIVGQDKDKDKDLMSFHEKIVGWNKDSVHERIYLCPNSHP